VRLGRSCVDLEVEVSFADDVLLSSLMADSSSLTFLGILMVVSTTSPAVKGNFLS